MELTEPERQSIPNLITARIPDFLKPLLSDLTLLERRRLGTVVVMLINEGIPVKRKVHDHKYTLIDIVDKDSESISFTRVPYDGELYKDSPGLNITINHPDAIEEVSICLSKEMALSFAANLSIFLNEVNL
jgi:hypothetical protein